MAWCYGTLMMPTRYGRMTTNVVSRSSLLSKSLVTPTLDMFHYDVGGTFLQVPLQMHMLTHTNAPPLPPSEFWDTKFSI